MQDLLALFQFIFTTGFHQWSSDMVISRYLAQAPGPEKYNREVHKMLGEVFWTSLHILPGIFLFNTIPSTFSTQNKSKKMHSNL